MSILTGLNYPYIGFRPALSLSPKCLYYSQASPSWNRRKFKLFLLFGPHRRCQLIKDSTSWILLLFYPNDMIVPAQPPNDISLYFTETKLYRYLEAAARLAASKLGNDLFEVFNTMWSLRQDHPISPKLFKFIFFWLLNSNYNWT